MTAAIAVGMERFLSAAQDDSVAAFKTEGGRVAGDVGSAFVKEQNDAEGNADFLDAEAVGANIAVDDFTNGIDLGGDLFNAFGHGVDFFVAEFQAFDDRRGEFGDSGIFDIDNVGNENFFPITPKRFGDFSQGFDFDRAVDGGKLARGSPGGDTELLNMGLPVIHGRSIAYKMSAGSTLLTAGKRRLYGHYPPGRWTRVNLTGCCASW